MFLNLFHGTLLINTISMVLIYARWSKRQTNFFSILSALSLLFAALVGWCLSFGIEVGFIYWFMTNALFAWVMVLVELGLAGVDDKPRNKLLRKKRSVNPKRHKIVREYPLLRFHLVGPLAFIVTFLCCLNAIYWAPLEIANRWVLATILFPIVWAVFATLAAGSSDIFRILGWQLFVGSIAFLLLLRSVLT